MTDPYNASPAHAPIPASSGTRMRPLDDAMVTTALELPGYRIRRNLGMVRGITVRSRNVVSDAIGGVQSMIGGRVGAYVKLAETARQEAYDELVAHARDMGANAILAMRYDANEIMPGVTEVLAYGTAVVVEPA